MRSIGQEGVLNCRFTLGISASLGMPRDRKELTGIAGAIAGLMPWAGSPWYFPTSFDYPVRLQAAGL